MCSDTPQGSVVSASRLAPYEVFCGTALHRSSGLLPPPELQAALSHALLPQPLGRGHSAEAGKVSRGMEEP